MPETYHYIKVRNGDSVAIQDIPVIPYREFFSEALFLLKAEERHCAAYYAYPDEKWLHFIMVIADDASHELMLMSHKLSHDAPKELESLTLQIFALHIFEREICENFGIVFLNHPWLKPVRYAFNRYHQEQKLQDYPFYSIKSGELHEVGVGPVHAGIIEPGHFRFICNGEMVLHLEIQLGWQHRGVEQLLLDKKTMLQRNLLAENIAGDTAVGHSLAFAQLMETLTDTEVSEQLQLERAIALELERIAIHTGDISALCVDVAYHLGANVFGILRTGIINYVQSWCGNRLGKSMIRVGGTNAPLTEALRDNLIKILEEFETHFVEMVHVTYRLPSVQNRFDFAGKITEHQARLVGTVGPSARMINVPRDIRVSHPFAGFQRFPIEMDLREKGDVFSRFLLKRKEIALSIAWIRKVLEEFPFDFSKSEKPLENPSLKANRFSVSLTEGWRGEICHCAVTDDQGGLKHYKVKDPSMHNWKILELSLRDLEISDFPINNKSYNLSYCGHDL